MLANVKQPEKCLSWPSNRLEEENYPLKIMKRKAPVSKDLIIEASRTSFGIDFLYSSGIMRFSGDSYPENAGDFFQPLLHWVKDFVRVPRNMTQVEFRVKYFNTSTSKYLFQIMEMLHDYQAKGNTVKVFWIIQGEDDDMLDTWRELMNELEMEYAVKGE